MILLDLLYVTSDSTNIYITNTNYDVISCYDGKNSINDIYNECDIVKIWTENDDLYIMIDIDVDCE